MTPTPRRYELQFPPEFDKNEWDFVQREYCLGVRLTTADRTYELSFFTPFRLMQDITVNLERLPFFTEKNLIVVPEVDRQHIERAVESLAGRDFEELP